MVDVKKNAENGPGEKQKKVSLRTVERLSTYRKVLEELHQEQVEYIYSHQFAHWVGVTPAQLRKDLSIFGSFGNVARGYNVGQLIATISGLLGTEKIQHVALIGLGNLGRTLLTYRGFEERGFSISVVFDVDPEKAGGVYAGRRCYHTDELEECLPRYGVSIAMLASRRTGLQELVERLARCGIRSILNFVPRSVVSPPGVFVEDVDIAARLEKLSFLNKNEHRVHTGQKSVEEPRNQADEDGSAESS